jgi:hypothetical protein
VIPGSVPGCDKSEWYPERALPGRALLPAEQARCSLMDPREAAKKLGGDEVYGA